MGCCDDQATHYEGCECHEKRIRLEAKIDALRDFITQCLSETLTGHAIAGRMIKQLESELKSLEAGK